MQHLDQAQVRQVAVQRRRGPLAGFLDRVDRELERDAACVANAVAYPVGELHQVTIAGAEVAAGLGDADDGPAGLQLVPGEAVIHVPLEVERGHARVGAIVEPASASECHAIRLGQHKGEGEGFALDPLGPAAPDPIHKEIRSVKTC